MIHGLGVLRLISCYKRREGWKPRQHWFRFLPLKTSTSSNYRQQSEPVLTRFPTGLLFFYNMKSSLPVLITLKSPLNHPKDIRKTVKRVSDHFYCFWVQIQDIHNFPYILLMFTISLGYLWWNQGVTTQMKVLNEPILIVLIVTYPFLTTGSPHWIL